MHTLRFPSPSYFVLDADRNVIATENVNEWSLFFEQMDRRRVDWTEIAPGKLVSTVFMGLDGRFFPKGPPLVFETVVMIGEDWDVVQRAATWAEAVQGHQIAVDEVRRQIQQTEGAPR